MYSFHIARQFFAALVAVKSLCLILFAIGTGVSFAATGNAAPPVGAYGRLPSLRVLQLSPNGQYLASIQNYQGSEILAIQSLTGGPPSLIRLSDEEDSYEEISSYSWINDERLALFIRGPILVGPKYNRMIDRTSRLIAINRDGTAFKKLPDGGRGARYYRKIIDVLPDDDKHVLVTGDNSNYETNVYKLNVYTGKAKQTIRGRVSVYDYRTDYNHDVRVRFHWNRHTENWEPYHHEPGSLNWKPVFKSEDAKNLVFVTFTSDDDVFLVNKKDEENWSHIYSYSLSQKKLIKEVISFEGRAFGGIIFDSQQSKVIGYSEAQDYWKSVYSDAETAKTKRSLEAALPGQRISLGSQDRSRTLRVIVANTENDPTTYYLYNKSKGALSLIGHQYPDLEKSGGYQVQKLQYVARDGLELTAYLTLPEGPSPYKTIILPHGGPTARDYMQFDYWTQFLASRGYAVMQPQFRGSTGHGKKFQESGYGEWGLKMQDDVTDATRHLIKQGVANPAHICIMGWSYGGYAALMGAAMEPDLYKCALAGGAVTDIPALMKDEFRFKNGSSRQRSIGHMKKDSKKLKVNSPINRVSAIKVPVLIFHGEFDSVVDVRQGRKMAAALKPTGYLHKYIELKNGDHHLSLEENRLIFLQEIEAFFAANL